MRDEQHTQKRTFIGPLEIPEMMSQERKARREERRRAIAKRIVAEMRREEVDAMPWPDFLTAPLRTQEEE